jgi:ankyrin repeat protein
VAVLHNHLPLLRMLIAKRANVNAANKNQESALHLAAQR